MFFAVSAGKLVNRTFKCGTELVSKVSLFPLFNLKGEIVQLMMVLRDSDKILMIPGDQKLIKIDLLGRICVGCDRNSLESFTRFNSATVEGLYHFDPYMKLYDPRFSSHWALDLLKQSNCIDRFPQTAITACYSRDLTRLKMIILGSGPLNLYRRKANLKEMNREYKPIISSSAAEAQKVDHKKNWQFDPIWKNFQN